MDEDQKFKAAHSIPTKLEVISGRNYKNKEKWMAPWRTQSTQEEAWLVVGGFLFNHIVLLLHYRLLLLIRSTLKAMQHVEGNILCRLYTMHEFRQIWRKSRIMHNVYPGDSCLIWFVIRQFATTSSFCMNHQGTGTWFSLICQWSVYLYTPFVHFGGFILEVS